MKHTLITIAALCLCLTAFGQRQNNVNMEKEEMKDTVVVDGKLVEVSYRIIGDAVKDGFSKIENGVVEGYKNMETGVVDGYKNMETCIVSGFNSVNDWFISKLFQRKGESLEDCKKRLQDGATRGQADRK